MKTYCPYCRAEEEFEVIRKDVSEFKGEQINTFENIGICKKCHNELYLNDLEEENNKRIYEAYSKKLDIITGKDIIEFREKYNISQRELTSILNFGKMTINRYERGGIPTKSQSDYLKLIINNSNEFYKKVEEAYTREDITNKTYNKIMHPNANILNITHDIKKFYKDTLKENLSGKPDIYNGYNTFDLGKTENIISYIADKVKNLTLTSLNKYLWYIDMLYYKNYCKSITGLCYVNYTHGPVIFGHSYNELSFISNKYKREDIELKNGYTMTKIESNKNYDLSSLNKYEKEVIDLVIEKFKNMKVTEISKLSHQEDGWKNTKQNQVISFKYASTLKNI